MPPSKRKNNAAAEETMPAKRQTRSTVKLDEDVQEVKPAATVRSALRRLEVSLTCTSQRKASVAKAKSSKPAAKVSTSRVENVQPVASTSKAPAKKPKQVKEEDDGDDDGALDIDEPPLKSKKPVGKKPANAVTIDSEEEQSDADEVAKVKVEKAAPLAKKGLAYKATKLPVAPPKKTDTAVVVDISSTSPPPRKPAPPAKKASPPKKPVKEQPFTQERAMKLFDAYADPDDKKTMDGDGLQRLFEDADIDMAGVLPFLLAFESKAQTFGTMERDDWSLVSATLQVDSPARLRTKLEECSKQLGTDIRYNKSPAYWEDFYGWLFKHLCVPGQKSVGIEMACAVWDLLFTARSSVGLDWIAFLKELRGISPDVWFQIGMLAQTVELGAEPERKLVGYQEEDAWPALVDEYAVWVDEGRPDACAPA